MKLCEGKIEIYERACAGGLTLTVDGLAAARRKVDHDMASIEAMLQETRDAITTRLSRGTVLALRERCVGAMRVLSQMSTTGFTGGIQLDENGLAQVVTPSHALTCHHSLPLT